MVLWCHTVTSSVQGSTMRTIARMSRRFGISKADWAHSSSLPEQQQGRERDGPRGGGSTVMSTGEKRTGMGWTGQTWDSREAECWLAGLTSAHNPPIAEAGLQSPARPECEKGWLFLRTVRNPVKHTPERESRRWPETWAGARVEQDQAQLGVSQCSLDRHLPEDLSFLPAWEWGASVPCRDGNGVLSYPVSSAGCRGQGHRLQTHLP